MNFQLRIVIVLGVICTVLLMVLAEFHSRQASLAAYQPNMPRSAAVASPALVGTVRDRDGRIILSRRFAAKQGGRSAVVDYVNGAALGAVGVGRNRVVGGMLPQLRAPGTSAPWSTPELGGWYRTLLGDGGLCPRPLPNELVCSLDSVLCLRIYQLLKQTGKPAGSVVVLNKNAEAVALVDFPGPDVDESDKLPDSLHSLNVFLSWPPASTFKPVVAAFMLQYGFGDVNADVQCRSGCWMAHGETHGLREALVRSCNPWFRHQASSLPTGRFLAFLSDVGFFQEPALGVPATASVTPIANSQTVDPEMAIGMQILTSPLSLACAYGTITDPEGRRFAPSIFLTADGRSLPTPKRQQVLRPDVTAAVREHLRAVATYGTASELGKLLGKHVGAKTGTANGAALLVVVTPIESPEFILAIRVKGAESGASLCGLAAHILKAAEEECR